MSKLNKPRFTFLDIKSVTPSTGKQIRRPLNYCAEVSSNLIKLLFPVPVISIYNSTGKIGGPLCTNV